MSSHGVEVIDLFCSNARSRNIAYNKCYHMLANAIDKSSPPNVRSFTTSQQTVLMASTSTDVGQERKGVTDMTQEEVIIVLPSQQQQCRVQLQELSAMAARTVSTAAGVAAANPNIGNRVPW